MPYESAVKLEQILSLLSKTPARIAELTAGLAPVQLQTSAGGKEWSANEVLGHLRSCADVWGDCMLRIVAEGRPTIRAVSPRTWIEGTDYREQKFLPSLQAFTIQRTDLLAFLERLSPKDWSRSAMVTGVGKPLVKNVYSYAERLARHERAHLIQIEVLTDRIRK